MKIRCLSCEALARMVYINAAFSPHMIDVDIIRLGLHNTPDSLRDTLQARIDALAGSGYDAVVLAVAHDQIRNMGIRRIRGLARKVHVLYDVKYMFGPDQVDGRL